MRRCELATGCHPFFHLLPLSVYTTDRAFFTPQLKLLQQSPSSPFFFSTHTQTQTKFFLSNSLDNVKSQKNKKSYSKLGSNQPFFFCFEEKQKSSTQCLLLELSSSSFSSTSPCSSHSLLRRIHSFHTNLKSLTSLHPLLEFLSRFLSFSLSILVYVHVKSQALLADLHHGTLLDTSVIPFFNT